MENIVLKGVNKNIKGVQVLNDINLTFEKGKIYGLHGHNGSGKTMLLRIIAGLIKPTKGEIKFGNKILHKNMDFPESIGVLIENPNFWSNYTGKESLQALAKIKNIIGDKEIIEILKKVGLNENDKRTVKKYSLGMKKRLGIAQSIMEKPEIILFDEPTNALDKNGIKMFHSILEEELSRGTIIIIASHNVVDIDLCETKIEMSDGNIVWGE